ncbi:catechol 2,3-dioxygenase-like lactoylglutathione lyase family enzyme [Rhodobium gokarnense]|uniref:Catechol 2,3-dioxygenase-like lactoylglutathione lyase family enzyme n=1 Tax=Rhodobium gokarnense TaxID=364296 RepID=A0ABT3HGC4_9HYPH|nr:catechol 2,3-dioxygenase-like lactoylglutathione lyase family enzyme [Rhodobium gokarnense]
MSHHVIDHISLNVADYERAKAFYAQALAPLGFSLAMEVTAEMTGSFDGAGLGVDGKPFFWLMGTGRQTPIQHIAFGAESRALVDAFYEAALAAGGTDNGAPGLRLHYHPNYYGAFVLDPEGHNIEAVCHAPE